MAYLMYTFDLDAPDASPVRSRRELEAFVQRHVCADPTCWGPILCGTTQELEALGAYQNVAGEWRYATEDGYWFTCNVLSQP